MAPRSTIRLPNELLVLLMDSVALPTRRTAPRPENSPVKRVAVVSLMFSVVPTPRLMYAQLALVWRLPPAMEPTVSE